MLWGLLSKSTISLSNRNQFQIQEEKEQKLREKEERKKEKGIIINKTIKNLVVQYLCSYEWSELQAAKFNSFNSAISEYMLNFVCFSERKLQEEKEEKIRKKEETIVAEQSKIRKTSEAFVKFFVPKKSDGKITEDTTEEKTRSEQPQQQFMSFQVKEGMKMAPVMRRLLNDEERTSLEKIIADKPAAPELYLSQLKSNKIIPRIFGRTLQDDEDEKCSNDDDLFVIGK